LHAGFLIVCAAWTCLPLASFWSTIAPTDRTGQVSRVPGAGHSYGHWIWIGKHSEMDWQIIGHDWAVSLLQDGLAAGRVAHAILFTGPPQIGKTQLALVLAQALNCQQPAPPCGRCSSCLKIQRRVHPDVRVIEGEGAGGGIKIDQVRALQREAILSPYEGKQRVFVLRRIDLASTEAANSLLKTLEEPPAHVVLVLTAVQAEALPATVVSRCQRLDLRPAPRHIVEAFLEGRGVPAEKARLLARLSGGRVGWAVDASQDQNLLQQRQQRLDQLIEILSANRVERLEFAQGVSQDPVDSRALLELWMVWWRDLFLVQGQGNEYLINVDRKGELEWLAGRSTLAEVRAVLNAIQETTAQLEANVNARLAWEGLLLQLPRWQPIPGDHGSEIQH
jgi:DNA polymerase-3 subunit delta'